MENRSTDEPVHAARCFSSIKRRNYFAHSIREMEREIYAKTSAKRIPYHITTKECEGIDCSSAIVFFRSGCTIFLPKDCPDMNDKDFRFLLAHELGHVSYNIDGIETITGRTSPTASEEGYAWKFAYYLIKHKSDEYKNGVGKEYTYNDDELGKSLIRNVKMQRPELYDEMVKFLATLK